jgi:hypothetical protein
VALGLVPVWRPVGDHRSRFALRHGFEHSL